MVTPSPMANLSSNSVIEARRLIHWSMVKFFSSFTARTRYLHLRNTSLAHRTVRLESHTRRWNHCLNCSIRHRRCEKSPLP
jgi:hypothetical protein